MAHIAIEIPDDIVSALTAHGHELSRAITEAVAVEAYRSGAITPAQVQAMLGLNSRWETDAFLRRAAAHYDYTMEDLNRDIAAVRDRSAP